ncbi:hypothetical protein A2631_05235 [Candidatus Daviesbacteria bacterium RIFCSPHIGHO2_01_FULL_44_29]|uniref:Peptidase C51 domain-containing protein n=1 Tax=Candidatus Daviesbacteria bacterium RIFCSPHIGHO2_02_FULL_43_12 TaxID=1797776 RepID=A0A1F5KGQ4_9BACT|nr:MAG: hypothetical protein A2631_05235 [Candidatus Daviesbacteria bacterium RIFCSPHIGHO2_01_FULL_44_29]OGE40123.1 MAG: hypothetical protein A3D25_04955 [Candidatus Daviesbacteria bacterium RIFCSPHIGHO2_02_FULL_43_12]OGE41072.1 MAG: hypothetical protein A3E86_05060 [Candidatus Daviesbacteria bacterium RIFCSPHIGHO2_12_FULL_47_45]OGE70196.1 MAG: hypothetical protein A3B55_00605 [Candidatus Daviesbacteria bacterium RIFCSPLOWO2_01_FULL_43_15]
MVLLRTTNYQPRTIYAANASSQWVTKVGAPTGPAPVSGVTGELTQKASQVYTGFIQCSKGSTYGNAFSPACFSTFLTGQGYDEKVRATFETRRRGALYDECVQCLGFVSLSATLQTGQAGFAGEGFGSAAQIYNKDSFTTGGKTYSPVATKNVQPGDIAVAISGEGIGDAGHISIVKEVKGLAESKSRFTAFESNFPTRCVVNNAAEHNISFYKFWRGS